MLSLLHHPPFLGPSFEFEQSSNMIDICRNDEWNSDRPSEERKYDGPAGMDPDGVIDSNWEEVRPNISFLCSQDY